jgi:hypothetical protein
VAGLDRVGRDPRLFQVPARRLELEEVARAQDRPVDLEPFSEARATGRSPCPGDQDARVPVIWRPIAMPKAAWAA